MTPKEYYYTHFQTDFGRFFSSLNRKGSLSRRRGSLLRIGVNTLYPKMDGSAGWAGSISHVNPFAIFNDDFIRSRDLDFGILEEEFESYATFILEDLETFFNEYGEQIGNINWAQVKTVMQKDRDIGSTPIGIILYNELFKSVST
jgi:hypothetical protein